MNVKTLDQDEVIELLRKRQGDKSLRQFAEELGISAPYLSDIYRKQRAPGPAVLDRLGLEARREVTVEYGKKRSSNAAD